jgi:hypothetical protein
MNIKSCCGCEEGKEIIYCGCECHKEHANTCSHKYSKYMGEIPNTGRLICQDCGEQIN